jgi:transcriptional regulator with XRE-family HTH domain
MPSEAAAKSPFRAEFGLRIRMLRTRFRLTQEEFALAVGGLSHCKLSHMENGLPSYLSLDIIGGIIKFATAQGISLTWLFRGEGPMELPAPAAQQGTPDYHQGLVKGPPQC